MSKQKEPTAYYCPCCGCHNQRGYYNKLGICSECRDRIEQLKRDMQFVEKVDGRLW